MTILIKNNIVVLGSSAVVEVYGKWYEYTVLETGKANIDKNEISSGSPLGRALLGRKEGEIVQICLPDNRTIRYKIIKIKNNFKRQNGK